MNWLAGLFSIGINITNDSGVPDAARRGPGGPSDAQLSAAARAQRVLAYRSAANAGAKYKPNAEDKELIGIQDAVLFWASESGVDNSTDDAGNSGIHLSVFDTSTRADSAQIKLLNDSGITQYVVAAAIKAKPIIRMSGDQGFTHDAFVDYQDIFLSGENTYEFGNNFIVTKAQVEQLADFYAKTLGVIVGNSAAIRAKHIYSVTIPGRCWWFEPGEWYTLQVGGAGQREYIDAVVECYGVQVEAGADGLGATRVDFREVEQNWVKDSNAVARFLATGDPRWKPNNFGRVVVAARDYMGTADYYCDGTADQTEIQAAIDYLANAFGGGLVELTEGQFNVTAAIELSHDNMILSGHGKKTIVDKNCNDYAIEIVGTSGTHIMNTTISNIAIQRNAADTNGKSLIYLNYCDSIKILDSFFNGTFDASTGSGFIVDAMSVLGLNIYECIISNCKFKNSNYPATRIENDTGIVTARDKNKILNCDFIECVMACFLESHGCTVANCGIKSCLLGIGINAKECVIANNVFNDVGPFDFTSEYVSISIYASADKTIVTGNTTVNCGNLMLNGSCEDVGAVPAIDPEVANTLTQCTYATSAAQAYSGSNSFLLTKTVAAGTAATAYLTDNANTNDLHGLYAGQEYRFGAWIYIPAGGMTGAELTLVVRDYVAAWEEAAQACALTYDAWQYVEVTKTLRAGSIGATFGFAIASTAANTETAYTDNLRLTPMGTGNLHNQNFYDAGTNTYTGV